VPDRIGPYEVLRPIGGGGMGDVFLALHPDGRTVAVKTLRAHLLDVPSVRLRLRREVETMQKIRHDHVAEVVDFDLGGKVPYLVTQYAQGRSLDRVVAEKGPLGGAELIRFGRAGTEAVAAVHAVQVVHRDIKPSNIMVSNGLPIIIDFGIAHAVDATRVTQEGQRAGTIWYMAPELWDGAPVSPAVDVFAWAATMVFAATGRHAFQAPTDVGVRELIRRGRPDLTGVPAELREMIVRALATDPRDRPEASVLADQFQPRAAPQRGPDRRVTAEVDLGQVITGGRETVQVDGRRVSFTVPAGAADGTEVTVAGEGDPGRGGGPPGDLIVTLAIRADAGFTRTGYDLLGSVSVQSALAAEGGLQKVLVPGGEITVRIPPGLADGQVLKIRGRGVPKPDGSERGDLYLKAVVALSAQQHQALETLSRCARLARRDLEQAEKERVVDGRWNINLSVLGARARERLNEAETAFRRLGRAATATARADLAEVRDATERIGAIAHGGERGPDVRIGVSLDLAEVVEETVHVCRIDDADVEFTVPAGIRSGQVVTHKGMGGSGRYGGEPGDLMVTVTVRPHADFRRDEEDLHYVLRVPPEVARKGGERSFDGIDGRRITLRLPSKTPEGRRFRIPERGLPGENRQGDLIVEVRFDS
jgi:DnaJ-class molecular chaperone